MASTLIRPSRKLEGIPISMLGGDSREVMLAKALLHLGCDLRLVGFPADGELAKVRHFSDPWDAIAGTKCVIVPISNTDTAGRISARPDGSPEPILLTELIPHMKRGLPLLIGVIKPIIREIAGQYGIRLIETADLDEIAILNAIPTAEGAIQVAMEETDITIHGARCLVVGLGRCGFVLAERLNALGAKVTVTARSSEDLARAIVMGCEPLLLNDICTRTEYDIIFNTVPALVLGRRFLRLIPKKTVIIDLAASPGGVDFEAARQLGLKAILALSLPAKVAPKTAGEILVRSIPRLLEEILGEENDER